MKHLLVVAALLLLPTAPLPAAPELPDIGDSSSTVLSAEQQRRIGESVMRSIRRSGKLYTDPEAEQYLSDLGYRLAARSDARASDFTFFLVNDPTINAFAVPGGYIGIHTGLLLAADEEAELASVLAHEIAHITQHHTARTLEKAGRMNLSMAAAMLAAVILGADNPEIAEAALATAAAGSTQMQLDFTRTHEKEADRVGMQLLAESGFDPGAMPTFFERLNEESRFSSGAPEFLRTHPVTTSRIADSRNRAAQLGTQHSPSSDVYGLVRARTRALTVDQPLRRLRAVEEELKGNAESPVLQYERAVLLRRLGREKEATTVLGRLHRQQPERIAFALALGETQRRAGLAADAEALYAQMLKMYPGNRSLMLDRAKALLDLDRPDEAAQVVREVIRAYGGDSPEAFRLLARAENTRGEHAASHLALAHYYDVLDEPSTALTQLELARRYELDYYQTSQIEAFSEELKARLKSITEASRTNEP